MAYIVKFKIPGNKWIANIFPHSSKPKAKRLADYMESQHDPSGKLVKTKTKIVKVDMRKSKSSIRWEPK